MEIYQTEEQQVEAIKSYWQKNGNTIIAGIVLGFAGFIGFNVYQDNKFEQELAVSDSYQTLIEQANNNDETFTANAEKFISENGDNSYVTLAALALAKEAASHKDWAQAKKQLTIAIESAPTDGIKAIASLRLARVQTQLKEYSEALATLDKPLPESFTAAIEEIKGDVYLQQGKKTLARNAYQVAIAADGIATSPSLQVKLDDLAPITTLSVTPLPLTEPAVAEPVVK
ncbi:YfgM family protein [Colwellia ponticola]|uniref:Ancillary SecYEG translocon subunit n=1 Tax=Colwellia ponticola TaxID=2304625 RepID=A0A8H2JN61_9GAMM|nr:tetratricopeptide repeat protein [Colwellia ponticola]TMM47557.1 tetratricopeptide repeat protein [Colwellia ponticola]